MEWMGASVARGFSSRMGLGNGVIVFRRVRRVNRSRVWGYARSRPLAYGKIGGDGPV
mgnify:CR=1 FL=1